MRPMACSTPKANHLSHPLSVVFYVQALRNALLKAASYLGFCDKRVGEDTPKTKPKNT
jgi:hypothetical protein